MLLLLTGIVTDVLVHLLGLCARNGLRVGLPLEGLAVVTSALAIHSLLERIALPAEDVVGVLADEHWFWRGCVFWGVGVRGPGFDGAVGGGRYYCVIVLVSWSDIGGRGEVPV